MKNFLFRVYRLPIFVFTCLVLLASQSYAKVSNDTQNIEFTPLQSSTAIEIAGKLQSRHYLNHSLNDRISSEFLDNYLERLDSTRTLFLQSDIKEFEVYRYTLDDTIKKGDLDPGLQIFNRYQQRFIARLESNIRNLPLMVETMDFTVDESLEIDRSKEAWPKTRLRQTIYGGK